ncbi:MAG: hypothetical protein K2N91_03845, partial [Muribaculaceae bacterium]|nr:hypothetical protein [Muribaculaceae bacterium]
DKAIFWRKAEESTAVLVTPVSATGLRDTTVTSPMRTLCAGAAAGHSASINNTDIFKRFRAI